MHWHIARLHARTRVSTGIKIIAEGGGGGLYNVIITDIKDTFQEI